MNKPVDIDRLVAQEEQSDTICPHCGSTMTTENAVKGSRNKRRVDRLVCGCGYSTLKRTRREILRDLGIDEDNDRRDFFDRAKFNEEMDIDDDFLNRFRNNT